MKNNRYYFIALLLLIITFQTRAQTTDALRENINRIISTKKAKVGVSIIGNNGKDTVSINGDDHFPMQSVFKFHIALTVLSHIQQGKLSLNQVVNINKNELLPGIYSPLREKYPEGTSLPISEILQYTVSLSDNVGCDVLLRLIGGPKVVEDYFINNGFNNVSIKINEEVMQSNWNLQFQNWTTPKSASQVLKSFYLNDKKLLSNEHHEFIWKIMKQTETGKNRIKGELPKGTVVAHKTGWSGTNKDGITAAVNDIGVVFLPNGNPFFISVFITDSKEDTATCEKIIADITRASWDYLKTTNQ